MGTSTNATLFYGFCLEENSLPPWYHENPEDPDDAKFWSAWEEVYTQKKGAKPPKERYPKADTPQNQQLRLKYKRYWQKERELLEKEPCEIGTHCSDDCPEHYVTIKQSELTASRGYPEQVTLKHLHIKPEWDKQIREFCEVLGITPPKTFNWFLVSYWG